MAHGARNERHCHAAECKHQMFKLTRMCYRPTFELPKGKSEPFKEFLIRFTKEARLIQGLKMEVALSYLTDNLRNKLFCCSITKKPSETMAELIARSTKWPSKKWKKGKTSGARYQEEPKCEDRDRRRDDHKWQWGNSDNVTGTIHVIARGVVKADQIRHEIGLRAQEAEEGIVSSNSMMNNMKVNLSKCVRWIGWEPPDHDRVKCNVDGSYFKSTRDVACGSVARDTSGNFLFSFCHRIGCCEIIRTELRGIVDGLEMLWEKDFRKVMIECDSEVALELVSNGVVDTHPCSALVQRVRSLIDRHWDTELVHVFREANQAADFMAKLSHSLAEGFLVFDSPHVGLRSILAADLNGPLVPVFV
ncbi:reverse transcriptase [Senna tora]|uniref:Reverse transcriptase n=1 Tax=Senna tora TaxID=362788 RepID=A0A835CKA4_9FABA|nr:reverse transcriptase [Senna tora]